MLTMEDVWDALKRIKPVRLISFLTVSAVVLAVLLSHAVWHYHTGTIPSGVTFVASIVSLVIAFPMLQMFFPLLYDLDRTNAELIEAQSQLSARNQELANTRDALASLNEELEARVSARTSELNLALLTAQAANESKSVFLANMSHELRTPLNGIIGYAEMLAKRELLFGKIPVGKLDEYLDAILQSGHRLHGMVGDLLDLSKIEFEQYDIDPAPLSAKTLVDQVVGELAPTRDARGQHVEIELSSGDVVFETDHRAIHQILTNLLSNALKYSDEGATVTVAFSQGPGGSSFTVRDSGIGMSREAIEQATQPFSKFSDAHIASGASIGLGLSIVSRLCRLLGSELSLVSNQGSGTTARVDLPFMAVADMPQRAMAC